MFFPYNDFRSSADEKLSVFTCPKESGTKLPAQMYGMLDWPGTAKVWIQETDALQ